MDKFVANIFIPIILIAIFAFIVKNAAQKRPKKQSITEKPSKKLLFTKHEYRMYFLLKAALADYVICPQVSFCALITAKSYAARNLFNRKYADFVICNPKLHVIAIIELDDSSHDGQEERDASRDRLLTDAGYYVIRYRGIPEASKISQDIQAIEQLTGLKA